MTRRGVLSILIPIVAILLTILVVDFAAYYLVPAETTSFLRDYRPAAARPEDSDPATRPLYARGYPRGYMQADPSMGFDITPDIGSMRHYFLDMSYEVFSNDLGCFDRHRLSDLGTADYIYFAGDSFTWGYAQYDAKFPVIYEGLTGNLTLKCGVSHTGQRHQFEKFVRIVAKIGRYPKRVFVGYYYNDVANDLLHPHTSVYRGFQFDRYGLDANKKVLEKDVGEVHARIDAWLKSHSGFSYWLRQHSLVWSLLSQAFGDSGLRGGHGKDLASFYGLLLDFDFENGFLTDPIAEQNRRALRAWIEDSVAHGYELVFVLIPPAYKVDAPGFYDPVKTFIARNGGHYFDVDKYLRDAHLTGEMLYWPTDGHLNIAGNKVVGELLAKFYP